MLKCETQDFLKKINRIYPNWKVDDYQKMLDTWHDFLKDEELTTIEKALKDYVTDELNKFAPSISDILHRAKRYKPDPRFEGIVYWGGRTREVYPFPWDDELYNREFNNGLNAEEFYRFMVEAVKNVEDKTKANATEDKIHSLDKVFKLYRKWQAINDRC